MDTPNTRVHLDLAIKTCADVILIYMDAPSGSKFNKLRRRKVIDLKRIYNEEREVVKYIARAKIINYTHLATALVATGAAGRASFPVFIATFTAATNRSYSN